MTRRALVVAMCVLPALAQRTAAADRLPIAIPIAVFVAVVGDDEKKALGALARIDKEWHPSSAAPLIELLHFVQSRRVLGRGGPGGVPCFHFYQGPLC